MNHQAKRSQQENERLANECKARHAEIRKVKGDNFVDSQGVEWIWSRGFGRFITLPY